MHRDEKAKWIRSKYEDKEFLPPPPYVDVAMPQVAVGYCHIKFGACDEVGFIHGFTHFHPICLEAC